MIFILLDSNKPCGGFCESRERPLTANDIPTEDWDNVSSKSERGSGLTGGEDKRIRPEFVDECATACEANANCKQYIHDAETCFIGKAIRLSQRKEPKNGNRWRSGWQQDRIADWISKQPSCGFAALLHVLDRDFD